MKKIAVLMGGTSHERDVSRESGRNVAEALATLGIYDVHCVELTSDDLSSLPANVDAAYIALHGGWGENGGVQAALDELAIPYTGPGAKASRIAMDKIETKKVLDSFGVANAPWCILRSDKTATRDDENIFATSPFGYPVVVKVPRDGSSVGVFLAKNDEEYVVAIKKCFELDNRDTREALVEKYIPGREMTVGIIDGEALPAVEIIAKDGWYGFEEKYESNETRYPFLSDSTLPEDHKLEKELQELAKKAYKAVGCRGVTRVDFRVATTGEAYVLELNTSPGFTAHSLVPKAGIKTGLTFAEVCNKILSSAKHD